MSLRTFLLFTIALLLFDAIVLSLAYSVQNSGAATSAYLLIKTGIDLLFVITNLRAIRVRTGELGLLLWLVWSLCFGGAHIIGGFHAYHPDQAFTDVFMPALFILKVALIGSMLRDDPGAYPELKPLVRALILASILQIIIFMTVGRAYGAYAGISVHATVPIADAVARGALVPVVLLSILVFISGKRSILLSAAVAVAVTTMFGHRLATRLLYLFLAIMACWLAYLFWPVLVDSNDKLKVTVDALDDLRSVFAQGLDIFGADMRSALYAATAARSEEFYGLAEALSPRSLIFGLGAGFTYDYAHVDGIVSGYANAHFSPLALTYKFGILFCLAFYVFAFGAILKLVASPVATDRLISIALLMYAFQSLLSFNLFVEPLIPILCALCRFRLEQKQSPRPNLLAPVSRPPSAAGQT